ncbi:MAG: GRRM system radical SAM/SPASM domain protein [Phycisphaeraceae bacterium]|nr:MAG: GRRM system radical SAM/SPASM domain protein [Phycisphaeraceae bacterium]
MMQPHYDIPAPPPTFKLGPIRQIVLQGTSFCNINCRYCYLDEASRAMRSNMSAATAQRTFEYFAASKLCLDPVECRWHSGEPLTLPPAFYRNAFQSAVHAFGDASRFWFSIQTNGLLINDEWCSFFKDCKVEVGLSIDGPAVFHDMHRVDRAGRGTFDRVMAGVAHLRRCDIPFDAICVLNERSLASADELYAFFSEIGCRVVGFNTDDLRPAQATPSELNDRLARYRSFMSRMVELSRKGLPVVREIGEMQAAIFAPVLPARSAVAEPLAIVNVDSAGRWGTFSPELLTFPRGGGGSFVLGSVFGEPVETVVGSSSFIELAEEVRAGVQKCASSCEYFPVCGGGSPANKLFENRSVNSTETFFCRTRIQAVADVVLYDLRRSPALECKTGGLPVQPPR